MQEIIYEPNYALARPVESRFRLNQMRDYNMPAFPGSPESWPAWFWEDKSKIEDMELLKSIPDLIKRANDKIVALGKRKP